jgi:hypothetical protein
MTPEEAKTVRKAAQLIEQGIKLLEELPQSARIEVSAATARVGTPHLAEVRVFARAVRKAARHPISSYHPPEQPA